MAEITSAVPLCAPDGRLNPAAVGWSRRPLHTANLRGWGRTKRFDYWAIVTPHAIVGLTIASLDYAGLVSIVVVDRRTMRRSSVRLCTRWLAASSKPTAAAWAWPGDGRGSLRLSFASSPAGTRLEAEGPGVRFVADVGPGAESLSVVVPWSQRRFQYTVKDVGRPVAGTLHLGDEEIRFGPDDGSFAVLDHGRGKWPYSITWNWAAGYGVVAGRRVGLQLGGKWTDATGSTENGLFVDGRLHKIHEDLTWTYDRTNWMAPWRIEGRRVRVAFAPFHERDERTNAPRHRLGDPPVLRCVHRLGARRQRRPGPGRRPGRLGRGGAQPLVSAPLAIASALSGSRSSRPDVIRDPTQQTRRDPAQVRARVRGVRA